ncbi:hypothetical protein RhiLY_04397 [Ceratobasidium sp. AG-Ba]|nr:hypothetical protein RhiLY_04397 [Ceratobasidium sp. AG-Ba]
MADTCDTGTCDPPAPVYHQPAQVTAAAAPAAHDPLDPATFVAPRVSDTVPSVVIEFCDRCRWLHRASWVQTELFVTFASAIAAISLIPLNSPETGGRFRVWLYTTTRDAPALMWDRKVEGGFPELKVLKQRIRDVIQPGTSLGHSDKKGTE